MAGLALSGLGVNEVRIKDAGGSAEADGPELPKLRDGTCDLKLLGVGDLLKGHYPITSIDR